MSRFLHHNDLHEITALLPGDAALLKYVLAGDSLVVFVARRGGSVRLVRLPATDAADLANDWEAWVTTLAETPADEDWPPGGARLLAELGKSLLPQALLEQLDNVRQLVVVPAGPLFCVPFHALPAGHGHCLHEHFENGISYAPSAAVYQLCRADLATRHAPPTDDTTCKARTIQDVLQPARACTNLVFVGQGQYQAEAPEASYIECMDGRLTAHELWPRGAADLTRWRSLHTVVCLAGPSARTGQTTGGERAGLMWSALARGASRFIGTLWPVPTPAAEEFVDRLFQHWHGSTTLCRAVRQAAWGPSPLNHWAAFCQFGSDR